MRDIVNTLKKELRRLTNEIESLEAKRNALRRALAAVDGTPLRGRRAASTRRVALAATQLRAPRGRNQARVLRALTAAPQRLSAIATRTRLTMSNAGAVLRTLIGKGLASKAARGSYVLKKRSVSSTVAKPS